MSDPSDGQAAVAMEAGLLHQDSILNVRDMAVFEKPIKSVPGFFGVLLLVVNIFFIISSSVAAKEQHEDASFWIVIFSLATPAILSGFRVIHPNEAFVATFFGNYTGVLRTPGFRFIFPFQVTKSVSLRLQNFESPNVKVNDLGGCPVDIRAVIVWRVVDPAQSTFHIESLENFVRMQTESAIRTLASQHPYDDDESQMMLVNNNNNNFQDHPQLCLRSGGERIASKLAQLVQSRMRIAGVEVVEARISHLAYSAEIAAAMLMKQQATAIINARKQVVQGALGICKDTISAVKSDICDLSQDGQETLLNTMLATLVSEKNVSPVLTVGSHR